MHVQELYIHPVKSFRGVAVQEARIDEHGFVNDRIYMVALSLEDDRYKMLTQREFNKMALVDTFIDAQYVTVKHKQHELALRLPLGRAIQDMAHGKTRGKVDIWGSDAGVYDVGEVTGFKQFWKAIFGHESKYLDATLLVPIPTERRDVAPHFPEDHKQLFDRPVNSSFQDLYPGHLIGTASLAELNERVAEESQGQAKPVTARNFRPNMVISTQEPYEEDFWDSFQVGPITWYTSQLCPRCPIPQIDPETAISSKLRQPAKAMAKYRKLEPREPSAPAFGLSVSNLQASGTIKVGDPVQVLETTARY